MAETQDKQLPDYALKYAPIVWLHRDETFFSGDPLKHLLHLKPVKFSGDLIQIPSDITGCNVLAHPDVNKSDVFMTLDANIRDNPNIPELLATDCKPDTNGRSNSPSWIITVDKSDHCGPDYVDVFYFYFYPYNQGNKVLFTHFGNHVGDWEHAMIRFKAGVPQHMHLSAHSDGNAWPWALFEKEGDRPVIYAAGGSHALYPKPGTHNYSGIFLVGPQDYTSKGFKWDPNLNFVTASFKNWQFSPLTSSNPGHNKQITTSEIHNSLSFEGRWGNSFSELRKGKDRLAGIKKFGQKLMSKVTDSATDELREAEKAALEGKGPEVAAKAKAQGVESLSLHQKLLLLIWAEAPTGPRDKSLDRKNMNRWDNRAVCEAL